MTQGGAQQTPSRDAAPVLVAPDLEAPGTLHGEVWLTVQTRYAQRLILGRAASVGKPAIIGLVGFADRLRVIWNAAKADDPYADWWLIKIDEALERARQCIKDERAVLDQRLQDGLALKIAVAATDKPYRVQLQFANPYAYWGAHLVAEFDTTARTILTARHVGLLDGPGAESLLRGTSGAIRGLFAVPQGYRMLRLDRDAIHGNSSAAQAAARVMGELPADVLAGTCSAALSPRKVRQ